MNNKCSKIFQNKLFIEAIRPQIITTNIKFDGSGYCNYSHVNAMIHQKREIPIEIIDLMINGNITIRKKCITDSYNLKKYLEIIIYKNNTINEYFKNLLPLEIINVIMEYMWNGYFDNI